MDADVVVLGMGVGGGEVAERLAEAGLSVVGVEKELVGGECPYWACIPTKMMVRASDALAEVARLPHLGGRGTVEPDWSIVAHRIRDEATDDWDDRVAVERFQNKGGVFVRGAGRLTSPTSIVVDEQIIRVTSGIVVATGTQPLIPPIPGLDTVRYWTNRDAVRTTAVPSSLVIVGGGVVGCEFAQVFARFGSKVTVFEGARHLLPTEEVEACDLLHDVFAREGIDVRTGASAASVSPDGDGVVVTSDDGAEVTGERLLVATGRRTDLSSIGVDALGIDPKERWIPVDDRLRVPGVENVWAIGDVAGGGFTHVSIHHARLVIPQILGEGTPRYESHAVPRVAFTDPEIGAAGLTEAAARAQGLDVRTGFARLADSSRGFIHKDGNDGFIKVVEDRGRGVLVGATSVGPCGGEVLGMLTLAVHARLPTETLKRMIYAYPTFHRAVSEALATLDH
jgi:pyruvate/2-oxoglutarate dehydrogenase complex dihydrolipoamide dehydrogenase (E3) component